jgi:O-antigen/teichoic acid export membrane protein
VNALLGPVGYLMTMTGNQGEAARVLTVAALVNVLACALLTPRFGLAGAAAGTALAQVIWNVWMSVLVWRRLGVRATVF